MKRVIAFIIPIVVLSSCEFLDPKPIEDETSDDLWSHATYGQGLLTTAYTNLQTDYPIEMEYYTDNAVPSRPGTNDLALGSWTVENNPIGNWNNAYYNLKYINLFLENGHDLVYSVSDAYQDSVYRIHRLAEAQFLRAWYHWELLRDYAGNTAGSNVTMGIPIVTTSLELEDNLDLPRNTYEDCVQQIVSDCDAAVAVLPLMYSNGSDIYDGLRNRGRASGLGALALKARVYLFAASPAYGSSDQTLWQRAAQAAAVAINNAGGLLDLEPYGEFNDFRTFDHIWIQPPYDSRALEESNYPPSLYGSGRCNPSQNLVDAFPASDGYPIDQSALYNASNPYANRDERFYRFVFYNGDDYEGAVIQTYEGGADAPGGLSQQGTRTGYYMKKLLSRNVRLTPGDETDDRKYYVFLSKTELYLNFAEAANEAFGPNNASLGFSAADVMRRIRMRAGIDSDPGTDGYQDAYLDTQAAAGKDAFREFIRNSRRIELAFEGFRFWDIRRWNLPLNHTVRGVRITNNGGSFTYEYRDVENHVFQDYMRYIPVPYSQTLIMNNLEQNTGW
jgi:hypothetical protein